MNDYEDSQLTCESLPTTYLPSEQLTSAYPPAPFRSLDTPVHVVLHRLCIAVLAVHVLFIWGVPTCLPTHLCTEALRA